MRPPNQIHNPVPVIKHTRLVDVGGGRKEGRYVINLTKGQRTDFMTTREFFTQQEFTKVRGGIEKLQQLSEGKEALANLVDGKPLDDAQRTFLEANLGEFSNQPNAVKSVASWIKSGKPVPEYLLRVGDQALLPDDIRQTAKILAATEGNAPGAVENLYKIANGETAGVSERTLQTLKGAGFVNAKNEVNPTVQVLLQKEGALYRQEAGLEVASAGLAKAGAASKAAAPPWESAHPTGYLDSQRNVVGGQAAARYRSERPRGMEEFPMEAMRSDAPRSSVSASVPRAAAAQSSVGVEVHSLASSVPPQSIAAEPHAAVPARAAASRHSNGAAVAGGTTLVAPNPATATVAAGAGLANVGLGVVQEIAHWIGLANNPCTIEQTYGMLRAFEALGEKNQGQILAGRQDPLGSYKKALEGGDKLDAQTALAVYQKHILDRYRTGSLTRGKDGDRFSNDDNRNGKNAFKAADKLSQSLYDDAAKRGFQPAPPATAVQAAKADRSHVVAKRQTVQAPGKTRTYATP